MPEGELETLLESKICPDNAYKTGRALERIRYGTKIRLRNASTCLKYY